jgi:hypothetical protein
MTEYRVNVSWKGAWRGARRIIPEMARGGHAVHLIEANAGAASPAHSGSLLLRRAGEASRLWAASTGRADSERTHFLLVLPCDGGGVEGTLNLSWITVPIVHDKNSHRECTRRFTWRSICGRAHFSRSHGRLGRSLGPTRKLSRATCPSPPPIPVSRCLGCDARCSSWRDDYLSFATNDFCSRALC